MSNIDYDAEFEQALEHDGTFTVSQQWQALPGVAFGGFVIAGMFWAASRHADDLRPLSVHARFHAPVPVGRAEYPRHPYEDVSAESFETVVGNYTAMSLAFPYLQAGAMHRVFEHYQRSGFDLPNDLEITAAVGAFLCWDEFGGHAKVCAEGNRGLPSVLDTSGTHANLFKEDVRRVLGRYVPRAWSSTTKTYLRELQYGLASVDPTTRVGHMIGFEKHAEDMIGALWGAFVRLFGAERASLQYFHTHVGGDDPAEAYHVDMTSRMVAKVIAREDVERLFDQTLAAYGLNHKWCAQVARLGIATARDSNAMVMLCAS